MSLLTIYCSPPKEANKRNNNWLPPPWALAAMVVLGFNEFMTLLRYFFSLQKHAVSDLVKASTELV